MAWGFIPELPDKKPEKKGDRDSDLENILGNLLITKFQLDRLETMLSNHVEYTGSKSKFMFKHKDKWLNVSIHVYEQPQEKKEDPELKRAFETVGP